MKRLLVLILSSVLLDGCQTAPGEPPQQWQASTLSEQTISNANALVRNYQQCLNQQVALHARERGDSRAIAERILNQCEGKLNGIKAIYGAEKVPEEIGERYIRQQRSRAAQTILPYLMSLQAVRASEEESSHAAPPDKKN